MGTAENQFAIRVIDPGDFQQWMDLRVKLWPEEAVSSLREHGLVILASGSSWTVFVAEAGGILIGFLELSLRSYAEGCSGSPVPYVEGWFVESGWRGRGAGKALMRAAEDWSRGRGFKEIGSDALADNRLSRERHRALGFEEVETLVVFRKTLAE